MERTSATTLPKLSLSTTSAACAIFLWPTHSLTTFPHHVDPADPPPVPFPPSLHLHNLFFVLLSFQRVCSSHQRLTPPYTCTHTCWQPCQTTGNLARTMHKLTHALGSSAKMHTHAQPSPAHTQALTHVDGCSHHAESVGKLQPGKEQHQLIHVTCLGFSRSTALTSVLAKRHWCCVGNVFDAYFGTEPI